MHTQKHSLNDTKRYYSFRIVTYINYGDVVNLINDLESVISKYAFIKHDKDSVDEHIHILITFRQNKSLSKVLSYFPKYQNTFVEPTNTKELGGDFLYLTHSNDTAKYQYTADLIRCNDFDYFQSLACEKPQSKELINAELFEDIIREELDLKYLAIKYGRDFMLNFNKYMEFRFNYFRTLGVIVKPYSIGLKCMIQKLKNDSVEL